MSFKKVDPQQNFPELEKEILEFWNSGNIFEKSLEKNSKDNKFVFFEGPPTANGKPGIHHVLTRSFKDLICRYKTMKGYYVKRRAGWDTHGLPVEISVEKELGISGKKQIEEYGIEKFNALCKKSVWEYKSDWEKMTERIGFWIDLKNPYITYENEYIEKVWGLLKEIWEKDLIYSGFKVVPYCPRCGTTLSSHEVAQGYKNIEEETVYIKLPVKNEEKTYFLVWTTTPWTLPANVALAVGSDINYVKVKVGDEYLILAKDRSSVLNGDYEIIEEKVGKDLEGMDYEGLYPQKEAEGNFYKVQTASFVATSEGTGIVHIAPAYGEDDMNLKLEKDLPILHIVDVSGNVIKGKNIPGEGKFIKEADKDIKADLEKRKLLYKKENIKHDYPFCWRCESPLIYYAKSSWFIAMSKLREELLKNNEGINWLPSYIKEGRFGEWLKEVKDWAISRERYWGTPLPIWKCECGNYEIIGSLKELKEKSEKDFDKLDLHKPFIDEITIKCSKCQKLASRVPEVLDVWFDAGSMPFSSSEYPDFYPADFICEAIDQTRGWFYTMLAISTLLEKGSSYKNAICLAHVLDEKGKKMSKSKGNVIDPWIITEKFGADSLRWYFYTVNGPGDPKRLGERNIEVKLRQFEMLLWNIYSFFVTYANIDGWEYDGGHFEPTETLDRWIVSYFYQLVKDVEKELDSFNVTTAARKIEEFNTDLSTWYLRRSRKRRDKNFYATMFKILIHYSKVIAPFTPFIAEEIYRNLRTVGVESVHLCDWPKVGEVDETLISEMTEIRKLVEFAHAKRAENKLKVRQPLASATIKKDFEKDLQEILKEEINVKQIVVDKDIKDEIALDITLTPGLLEEGKLREIIRQIQDTRKKASLSPNDKVKLTAKLNKENQEIIEKNKNEILSSTNLEDIVFEESQDQALSFEVSR